MRGARGHLWGRESRVGRRGLVDRPQGVEVCVWLSVSERLWVCLSLDAGLGWGVRGETLGALGLDSGLVVGRRGRACYYLAVQRQNSSLGLGHITGCCLNRGLHCWMWWGDLRLGLGQLSLIQGSRGVLGGQRLLEAGGERLSRHLVHQRRRWLQLLLILLHRVCRRRRACLSDRLDRWHDSQASAGLLRL